MNKLPLTKRAQILAMLCEGSTMSSISCIADVSINTVAKLLTEAGEACLAIHDENIRGVKASRIQCAGIWSFCYTKAENVPAAKAAPVGAGDVWTWTALDADTKLMVAYFIGARGAESAMIMMDDLRARLANPVQLLTDGKKAYLEAVEGAFGADVDFAQLEKLYGSLDGNCPENSYSPADGAGINQARPEGNPDTAHVSTSHVERMALSIPMQSRRLTRLNSAFSNKLANHIHALALYFAFYNFCRIHKSLSVTPGMAAGITDRLWSLEDIVAKVDAMTPAPKKRGPYRKHLS